MPAYELWQLATPEPLVTFPDRLAAANFVRTLIAVEGVSSLDNLVCDPNDGNPESTLFGCDLLLLLDTR